MANALIDVVNGILDAVVTAINFVLQILPASPFQAVDFSAIEPFLANLNWFFPIKQILGFLAVWLAAVLIYYAYTVILRITQMID